MNFIVRFNNPIFLAQLILSVVLPILSYYGVEWKNVNTWGEFWDIISRALKNPYVMSLILLSVFNALTDPTTRGIGDSPRAMQYITPN